jgi:hypothetical protein
MATPQSDRGQMLLAEEYFATENPAFLETIRKANQPKALAGFADRWKKDPRPWAREQLLAYVAKPFNCPGHQPVVKHLFKHAEETGDHEVMVAFLVAFDRLVRREIRTKRHWDFRARTSFEEERLVTPRDVIRPERNVVNVFSRQRQTVTLPAHVPARGKLFKYRTRYYLQRRAWRYFRRLGHREPMKYIPAIVNALARYEDADLQKGENILDSWSLMHGCFAKSDVIEIGATHVQLKEGRTLGELTPAPAYPDAWKKSESAPMALALAVRARARLVRLWAMQLFQREHSNHAVSLENILSLLEHEDADVQQFGSKLLESSGVLATLPISSWFRLLQTKNEDALQRVCDAFAKHVSADRLDLAQSVELASVRPVPVARLGQKYLQGRTISSPTDREQISALANAKCSAIAGELTAWALKFLGTKENYSCDQVIRFFDSNQDKSRAAAWTWMTADSAPGLSDPALWSRLAETPHDDIRLRVVDYLQQQTKLPGTDVNQLENVWRSVLLGVHRGGRQKAKAVRQISQAIVENPQRVDTLLPVLAVAVRSVRGPESRAGLAAVVTLAETRPELAEAVRRHLPEMKFAEVAA